MNELKIGQTAERELVVAPEHLACHVGSGSVEVLATPMVAALMEGAASDLAQSGLADSDTTVGTQLSLEHLCPTTEGVRVKAVAELTEIDGRVLRFALQAFDNAGLIARGTHERVCVNRERFAQKAAQRKEQEGV